MSRNVLLVDIQLLFLRAFVKSVAARCDFRPQNIQKCVCGCGVAPGPQWRSLQRSPNPKSVFRGRFVAVKGREETVGKGKKGRERWKGKEKGAFPSSFFTINHWLPLLRLSLYFYFGFVFNRNIWRIFQLTPDLPYFFNEESLGMSTVLWHCWSSLFSNLSFQAIPENKSQCKREASNSFWPAESMRMYVSVVCAASASCCASLYNKRRYGIGCRAPFANLRPRTVSRRLWRHSVHRQYLTVPYILSLRWVVAACTIGRVRGPCYYWLPCYGALEIIVT